MIVCLHSLFTLCIPGTIMQNFILEVDQNASDLLNYLTMNVSWHVFKQDVKPLQEEKEENIHQIRDTTDHSTHYRNG